MLDASSSKRWMLTFSALILGVAFLLWTSPGDDLEAKAKKKELPDGALVATFAGGCFWCMEPPYDKLDGVYSTISGYIGGKEDNPTYKQVAAGRTGHTEAVQVAYDPDKITYEELLDVFWRNIDPTVKDRQFCDWGSQYRTGIFYHGDEQKEAALASLADLNQNKPFPEPIVTEITEASTFYPAEEYHQDFYKKNPQHYHRYRRGCGRDARLKDLWGDFKK